MPVKCVLIFILLFTLPVHDWSQTKPSVEIQLLSNDQEAELNLDKNSFMFWAKGMTRRIDSVFAEEKSKRDYLVLITLHARQEPDIRVHARPACTDEQLKKILHSLKTDDPVKTNYCDYSFVYMIRTNGGSGDPNLSFVPEYQDPLKAIHETFKRAGLAEKKALLEKWALDEVLPILSESETRIDFKFSGVQYAGRILREASNRSPDSKAPETASLTDKSSDYWRGVMEMSPGNEIIPLSKTMLYVSSGEFDLAKEYCELLRPFGKEKNLATYYVNELSWRLEEFNKELNLRVQRGIEQHDKGNYAGAIAVYTGILNDYSRSAWVNYELYYSTNMRNNLEKKDSVLSLAEWNKAAPVVYSCNPLYPVCARASTGKEGYLIMRRAELGKLFKVKEDFSKDLLKLGDIALDLGAYGYAAEVYWLCFSRLKKEDVAQREMLPYFLYALDKLGVNDLKKTFSGDFDKEFIKIDKARKKEMESSPVYKSFKNKG
jgi:hypothetical protein